MDSFNKTPGMGGNEEMGVGAGLPSVVLTRLEVSRSRSGSRSSLAEGDRDRSPIRLVEGRVEPLPSTSQGRNTVAGPAEEGRYTRSGRRRHSMISLMGEEDDGSDSDSSSSMSVRSAGYRKRGRPPTTGDYVGLAEAKRKLVEAREAERELEDALSILDPSVPPKKPGRSSIPLPDEETLAREFRMRPTGDVAACVLEHQAQVMKVASVSKGLRGDLCRALRVSAVKTRMAIQELAARSASDTAKKLEEEVLLLRAELAVMKPEMERLRARVEGGVVTMPPPPAPAAEPSASGVAVDVDPAQVVLPVSTVTPLPPRADERDTSCLPSCSPAKRLKGVAEEQRRAVEARKGPSGEEELEQSLFQRLSSLIRENFHSLRRELGLDGDARPSVASEAVFRGAENSPSGGRSKRGKRAGKGGGTQPQPSAPATTVSPRSATAKNSAGSAEPAPIEWAKVVGRRVKGRGAVTSFSVPNATTTGKAKPPQAKPKASVQQTAVKGKPGKEANKAPVKKALPSKPPRTAAVTITVPAGGKMTYAQAMTTARAKVDLAAVGIADVRHRRAATGAIILEVPGKDGAAKADALAKKVAEALEGTGVRVARPAKKAELRLRGLVDGTTPSEVATAVATTGGCSTEEVQTGEIRSASSGVGTIWVRCPAAVARKLAVAGSLVVGWTRTTVAPLQARPMQYYRCLELGHTRQRCTAEVDRSGRCYNCGDPTHKANTCGSPPKCPVCSDMGRPAVHRLGSRACTSGAPGKEPKGANKTTKGRKRCTGAVAAAPAPKASEGPQPLVADVAAPETAAPIGPAGPEVEME